MTRAATGPQLLLFEPWPLRERVSLRARHIRVDVRPDGEVVLTIPRRVSRAAALAFLEQQRAWVERTRARLARRRPAAPLAWSGSLERAQLRARAEVQGRRLLDEESARLGLPYRALKIRDPRTRWGSCGPDGGIMLSLRLVMAPPEVFRYVAIHELCHLRWHGHGQRFWSLVERQMPDYAQHRAWLRRHGDALQAVRLDS
jgi:predicted metal-dependent hydrolase